jgi:hypothetical protein
MPLIASIALTACGGGGGGSGGGGSTGPTVPPPTPTPAQRFQDVTAASGLAFVVGFTRPSLGGDNSNEVTESTFGGVAAGDCDNDGDIDLFITYGDTDGNGPGGPNRLYLNDRNGSAGPGTGIPLRFHDVAATAGVANTRGPGAGNDRHSGPTFADMDGDGHLDLFIGGLYGDPNRVYRNNGDCSFEDVTAGSGLETVHDLIDNTISAALGDYDLDGDIDLFLTHWGSSDTLWAEQPDGVSQHLFRNISIEGDIRFENVSAETGVSRLLTLRRSGSSASVNKDFTFTPGFARMNDDPWPDIALASDFHTAQLLLNDIAGRGEFIDATNDAIYSVQYGMGSAIGDFDSDGDLDWFVTSIFSEDDPPVGFEQSTGNRLLENPGGDLISENLINITDAAGVADGGFGWGACFIDLDNDQDLDIYHTNGWYQAYLGTPYESDFSRVFVSTGSGSFVEQARALGLDDDDSGRGVVCADFDLDGDVDILQLTDDRNNSATLWANVSAAAGRNSLRVKLVGLPPNTEAAGARIHVSIDPNEATQMREVMIGSNFTSQNPTEQVFGLGADTIVSELIVEWPWTVPSPGAAPTQPSDTQLTAVAASAPGETLFICHPGLPADAELDQLCVNR